MATKQFLDSLDDSRLDAYRNLKDAGRLQREGLFIAEGRYLVERLVTSSYETLSLLVSESRLENLERELGCDVPSSVPLYILPEEAIQELVGFQFHRGILACGRRRPSPALAEVLPPAPEPVFLVVCPDIGQAENLGQVIRNCRGFGVHALILGESCCDPFSRRALRVSMGNALHLPIVQSTDLVEDLGALKLDWGVEIIGTSLDERAVPLPDASIASRVALVFGNEADGIRPALSGHCDHFLTIPMQGGTDSLNVGVAAGIFLYHLTYLQQSEATG